MVMPTDPDHPANLEDDLPKGLEPDDDEEDTENDIEMTDLMPKRVVLIFQAADDGTLDGLVQSVVGFAEDSGLFAEHIFIGDIMEGEVASGTPLHQVLTGREPS